MTVYIVSDLNHIIDKDSWETHVSSTILGYLEVLTQDLQDSKYNVINITDVYSIELLIKSKVILSDDVFVFTNAWTTNIPLIKAWCEYYEISPKMYGFWHQDAISAPSHTFPWRKSFNLSICKCLHGNFFICQNDLDAFKTSINKDLKSLQVCKFPMDYLGLELAKMKNQFGKNDMLVFPFYHWEEFHESIFYDWKRTLKGVQPVFCNEKERLTREHLMNQIASAKVAWLPYDVPNLGQQIYECLLLGTIPMVPSLPKLEKFVPKEFMYPKEWTLNVMKYAKHAPDLIAMIYEFTNNYQSYTQLIDEQVEYLTEHYFDSEDFLNKIFGNLNKNHYINK
jgi:hypothetical protein